MKSHGVRFFVAGLALATLAGFLLFQRYRVDLLQYVVEEAFIQKAPPEVPAPEIRDTFHQARRMVRGGEFSEERYIQALLSISQRLEKVQRLTETEARSLLSELRRGPASLPRTSKSR
ncbi:MAG: hypothetical protein HY652_01175 [Acidobacteria bacterium]|nr:hypothetical protein [Acidobacteriota bacterium]